MKRTIYITYKKTVETITSKHDHRTSDGFFHSQWRITKWCGPLVSSEDFLFNSEDISSIKSIISKCTPKETNEGWGDTDTYEEPDIQEFYNDLGIAEKLNNIINDKYPFVFEATTRKLDYSFWDALNKSIIDPVKNYQSKEEKLNKEYSQSLYNLKKEYRHSLYDYYNENLSSLLSTGIIDSSCILPNLDVYPFDIACLKLNKEVVLRLLVDEYKYCKNEWVVYFVFSYYLEILPALINDEYDSIISDRFDIDENLFTALRDIFMRSIRRSNSLIRTYLLKQIGNQGDFTLFDLFINKCDPPFPLNRYEKYQSVIHQHIVLHASIIHKRIDLFGYIDGKCFQDYYDCNMLSYGLTRDEYFEDLSIIESDDDLEKAFNKRLNSPLLVPYNNIKYNIRERIKIIKEMSNDVLNKKLYSNNPNDPGKVVWEDL